MPVIKHLLALLVFGLLLNPLVNAESIDYYLPEGNTYQESIKTPDHHLGFGVGEFHARSDQIMSYMQYLADSSDRVHMIKMGYSWEKRPLAILVISAPENIQRLQNTITEGKDFRATEQDKLTVWIGYGVHGNEPSASNVALLSAYHFAAFQDSEHDQLLRDSFIVIDANMNPDGYDRFTTWVNSHRSLNLVADPMDREHIEAWPRGRTNHYRFDLNRDWLLVTQEETKNRLKWFQYFHAHVYADYHEMGTNSTYFFQPGVPSRNNPLTPKENYAITADIAKYHAKALDEIGSVYYNKQTFDDYYYGKGSTYPDIQGSVGILFEQASARGHLQDSINGPVSFPFAIKNQFVTSLSVVEGAYANKDRLIDYREQFFQNAENEANNDRNRGLVVGNDGDNGRLNQLVENLLSHGIEVFQLADAIKINGKTINEGIVVPYQQRQYRLIKAMFETRTQFPDDTFYDVSTWNFGHAFNLPYEAIERRRWKSKLIGEQITESILTEGRVAQQSNVAYVIDWKQLSAPAATQDLIQAGLEVRMARKPFEFATSNGQLKFSAGSIVIPVGLQSHSREVVFQKLQTVAKDHSLAIESVTSGLANSGIDLGSPDMRPVQEVKPLMLVGNGITATDSGHLWYFFDNHLGMALSQVEMRNFSRLDLNDYSHLLLVNGNYDALSDKDVARIKSWIETGGVVVGMKSANRWLSKHKLLSTDVSRTSSDLNNKSTRSYSEMPEDNAQRHIGGSIFTVEVDTSHPLGFGLTSNQVSAFKDHRFIIEPSNNPYHNVMTYSAKPLVSGFISNGNLENIANSIFLAAERHGRGSVIAIADNPIFRGYWLGTSRMISNSLFFGTSFARPNQ